MGIKVFWSEPLGIYQQRLRRYRSSAKDESPCPNMPGKYSYHTTSVLIGEVAASEHPTVRSWSAEPRRCTCAECLANPAPDGPSAWDLSVPRDDYRWPIHCACGYEYRPEDQWQVDYSQLYVAATGGAVAAGTRFTLRDAPVGAMWDAHWLRDTECDKGPDGICLAVRTPGGTWLVDGEASNCTRTQWTPVDGEDGTRRWSGRTHYCWPRKGDPKSGMVDVRKEHGETCNAGAGSILIGGYHGFLWNGELTTI